MFDIISTAVKAFNTGTKPLHQQHVDFICSVVAVDIHSQIKRLLGHRYGTGGHGT